MELITTKVTSLALALLDLIDLDDRAVGAGIPLLSAGVSISVVVARGDGRGIVGVGCGGAGTEDAGLVADADEAGVEVGGGTRVGG